MGDTRATRPVRANLSAGQLTSYGFPVEAAIGQRPMRYLVGRRFIDDIALTGLFVLRPVNLAGTYVWIIEDPARGVCEIETYIPTMKTPIRLVERHIVGCLPLTDVGYLDLMAWRYPGLASTQENSEVDMSWSHWSAADARRYLGPASTPGLTVTEATDARTGVIVARAVERERAPVRRWEVLEMGSPDMGRLPQRIAVTRPQTGHWTEFRRTADPVPVPDAEFDATPARLREAIEDRLAEAGAGRGRDAPAR